MQSSKGQGICNKCGGMFVLNIEFSDNLSFTRNGSHVHLDINTDVYYKQPKQEHIPRGECFPRHVSCIHLSLEKCTCRSTDPNS